MALYTRPARVADRCVAVYQATDGTVVSRRITRAQYESLTQPGRTEPFPRPALDPRKTWRWVQASGGVVTFDTADGGLEERQWWPGDATSAGAVGTRSGRAIPIEPGVIGARKDDDLTLSGEALALVVAERLRAREVD